MSPNSELLVLRCVKHALGLCAKTLPSLACGSSLHVSARPVPLWPDTVTSRASEFLVPRHAAPAQPTPQPPSAPQQRRQDSQHSCRPQLTTTRVSLRQFHPASHGSCGGVFTVTAGTHAGTKHRIGKSAKLRTKEPLEWSIMGPKTASKPMGLVMTASQAGGFA